MLVYVEKTAKYQKWLLQRWVG